MPGVLPSSVARSTLKSGVSAAAGGANSVRARATAAKAVPARPRASLNVLGIFSCSFHDTPGASIPPNMQFDNGRVDFTLLESVARVALRKVLVETELNRVGAGTVLTVFKAFDDLCFCDIVVSARRPVAVGVELLDG